jgi:flagellar biosynthesis protein FlhG
MILYNMNEKHIYNKQTAVVEKQLPYIITVCSGKGGVGKSVLSANIAKSLSQKDCKVLIWDTDMLFPNLHLIFGVEPPVRATDLYAGRVAASQTIFNIGNNLDLIADIPISTGRDIFDGSAILPAFAEIITESDYDFIIFDTAAGASSEVLNTCRISDLTVVTVTDEPTSLLDAYALIKILRDHVADDKIQLLVNNVIDYEDAEDISTKLNSATKEFLDNKFAIFGYVPYDRNIRQSILNQNLFIDAYRDSEVYYAISKIASTIISKIQQR